MLKGIDFSYGNGLTTAQIGEAGYAFVCRYLSGGSSKDIDRLELSNYKAAGIRVVFVWETDGQMPSQARGVADAESAQAELELLASAIEDSSVASVPVFFAADASTETDLIGYLRGAGSVIGKSRTAIYGGYNSVSAAFNAGLVTSAGRPMRGLTASGTTAPCCARSRTAPSSVPPRWTLTRPRSGTAPRSSAGMTTSASGRLRHQRSRSARPVRSRRIGQPGAD